MEEVGIEGETHQFGVSQSAAVAQVSLAARAPPPLWCHARVAVCTVLLQLVDALSPLSLLAEGNQAAELLDKSLVGSLQLSKLKLPARRPRRLQLLKQVLVLWRQVSAVSFSL